MKSNQILFTYRNNIFCMIWEISKTVGDYNTVNEYIRDKLLHIKPETEELRETPKCWKYTAYVR